MTGEFLYGLNQWVIFAFIVGLLCLSAEIGFRYGRRFAERTSPEIHSHVGTVEGALLGLLALLLGFAFAMAMSRFDTRKDVVLEEVNDLQTTFLRAQMLSKDHRAECSRLLREYLDSRIAFFNAGTDHAKTQSALEWTNRLQAQLWREAVTAAREDSDEVRTGYFIDSLNHLIDDHSKRVTAMENHVPEIIFVLLVVVATMTIAVTGYSSGLRNKRLKALRGILVFLIASTLLVILDLDRPRRGFIKVSERGLLELRQEIGKFAYE